MEHVKHYCTNCKTEYHFRYRFKINANIDTELALEALKGKVTMHSCPTCGQQSMLHLPVVYINVKKQFMVYYLPKPYLHMLTDTDISNDAISNLPGKIQGRYTSSPASFTKCINDFETSGADTILKKIQSGNYSPGTGLLEVK